MTTLWRKFFHQQIKIRNKNLFEIKISTSKGPFTVAKHFWELATENTKNIFDIVPPSFLPNMKNPCFWEDYKLKGDPYADSPYAPEIGKTIQYDPWGHTAYYKKARDRFNAHLIRFPEGGNTKRLRCLPYFYLISTPKSGTTTLWNQLRIEFKMTNKNLHKKRYLIG